MFHIDVALVQFLLACAESFFFAAADVAQIAAFVHRIQIRSLCARDFVIILHGFLVVSEYVNMLI